MPNAISMIPRTLSVRPVGEADAFGVMGEMAIARTLRTAHAPAPTKSVAAGGVDIDIWRRCHGHGFPKVTIDCLKHCGPLDISVPVEDLRLLKCIGYRFLAQKPNGDFDIVTSWQNPSRSIDTMAQYLGNRLVQSVRAR
ncbi:MAG: hypothetical protein AAF636_03540 [Pseudomonadota bacterium]